MKVGIMQPYFFPYLGYFQLIASVDQFIVYDNIKYTKKGWINRNRLLLNGKGALFSLPLKSDSDSLDIRCREIVSDFNRDKLLNQFKGAYRKAPYFEETYALLERIIQSQDRNLFNYLYHSIFVMCEHFSLKTQITKSSEITINHDLKGQERVIAICKAVGASTYINAIGGANLYEKEIFFEREIELKFIKSMPFEYPQLGNVFIPWLSIIDVMMFNPLDVIKNELTSRYELI